MAGKAHTAEQIIGKLREAEVELAQEATIGGVCRKLAITEQTYYRWRKEYGALGAATLSIWPESLWESGYPESFNGKLREELLNGEIFYTLGEAQVLVEQWRRHYNQVRPHRKLRAAESCAATWQVIPSVEPVNRRCGRWVG